MGSNTSTDCDKDEEPIFKDVMYGNIEGVKSMLDGGTDPNYRDKVSFPFPSSFFIFHVLC